MMPRTLRRFCKLNAECEKQMENAITKLDLPTRRMIASCAWRAPWRTWTPEIESRRVTYPKPFNTAPSTAPTGSNQGKGDVPLSPLSQLTAAWQPPGISVQIELQLSTATRELPHKAPFLWQSAPMPPHPGPTRAKTIPRRG
jgi:hypothetical protein